MGVWIYSGIDSELKMLWDALSPIFIPTGISFLFGVIIIGGIRYVTYNWFRLSVNLKKLARKKIRMIKSVVNLLSALKDICSLTKL
jgi:hypothetical protein